MKKHVKGEGMNNFLKVKGSVLTLIFLMGLLFSFIHPAAANVGEVESDSNGIRKTEVHDAKSGVPMTGDASWFDKLFDNLKKMKDAFIEKLENAKAWMKDGWEEFKDWFGPKWEGFTDWLGDLWEGVKDFFSQEWVQTLLKVIGAILVVVGVILLGVWALAAIGIALSIGTIVAAVGFGIAGVVFTFASGERSFWGMVAGGLASGISFFGGLGVLRLLGAFRLIPASGLLRWVTLGGLGGAGAVGFTILHGALHFLFTGDSSLWKHAFTFESLFFNFTLGAVMGPVAARIFGSLGVKQILSKQGNLLATVIARIVKRPVSQVANVLGRIWAAVKGSTIYSAITAGVFAVLDTIIQWKENGKVDWSQTGKRAAIVFTTTLVIGLGTFAIPKLSTMGCACGDEIASSVTKQGKSSATVKQDTPDLANTKTVNETTAEEVNAWWKDSMGYDQPPYKPGTKVKEIELTESTTFVRVYDGENSTMYGGWMMRAEDIQGLTAKEIQDKFALPYTPKFIADVNLAEGTVIRTGIVNPLFGHKGGGTQFDLKGQRIGDFGNERSIETVLSNKGTGNGYNYWNKTTEFKNVKVYQRDDIIDPNMKDARGRTNLERMKKGLAPLGPDGKSVNLHHTTQRNESSIAEVTQTFHQENSSIIHINPNTIPSGINRTEFNKWRTEYWKNRAKDYELENGG